MKGMRKSMYTVFGELGYRINKLYKRMEQKEYRPDYIFNQYHANGGWWGDWEGRTILCLVMLQKTGMGKPLYLDEIMAMLPEKLNQFGYFGDEPKDFINEQQLAGNSWYLRGLCEYYSLTKNEEILGYIKSTIEHLYLPTLGHYAVYPRGDERICEGAESGEIVKSANGWSISTDIGCAFIALDGLTAAYEILGDAKLKTLIEEMIEEFFNMDFIKYSFQTHATLTALRGILRFGIADEKIFQLYITQGMTENYANYNWFGRPFWTEPCAIVDSFIVAFQLYQKTKNIKYLHVCQNIRYNALAYAQRDNGGFGTDKCSGAENAMLSISRYEAYWCCTMRGGEGLSEMKKYILDVSQDELRINFYDDVYYNDGTNHFSMHSEYPYDGYVKINVHKLEKTLFFYMPENIENFEVYINGRKADFIINNGYAQIDAGISGIIELKFHIPLHTQNTMNVNSIKGYQTIRHGNLILSAKTDAETNVNISNMSYLSHGRYEDNGVILEPLSDMILKNEYTRQILFKA